MEMTIIYIILIALLLGIIFHIFFHLMVVFHKDTTDACIKEVLLKDPYKYVRTEEMRYFMRNMVYLFLVSILLLAACNGNMKFEEKTKQIEINVKNK